MPAGQARRHSPDGGHLALPGLPVVLLPGLHGGQEQHHTVGNLGHQQAFIAWLGRPASDARGGVHGGMRTRRGSRGILPRRRWQAHARQVPAYRYAEERC